ncbi:hypothetical protein E1202_07915 [Saccharopolyspora karakumensis]|uniref:Major Facilitator Superfamily protein n=1 Tax=Saccharopolyspora karakumensis TaxID=2530386 RepID=A0A4R5BTZ8_9PSEU|nr:hypothetical protein [Saccharopolyspora karakumensis]TDD90548.1 hypothetical protein E1202_07915 [Saccharopolyspora karakumensis]
MNTAGIPKPTAAVINFCALLFFMPFQPLVGALSNHIGWRPVMFIFSICLMVLTVPLMTVPGEAHSPIVAFILMVVGLTFVCGYSTLSSIIKPEMFPTKVLALGVGLCHALITATFGWMAESIALTLKKPVSKAPSSGTSRGASP